MTGWQPIETAPTFEWILVGRANQPFPIVARNNGRFWVGANGRTLYELPTHWQPLPEPPK